MTSNNEKKLLTKSDINRVFWRSFTVNASFNYERQMSQGAQYALSPILQKLYPDKKELGEALIAPGARLYVIDDQELQRIQDGYPVVWKNRDAQPKLCFMGCPHMSLEQLKTWTDRVEASLAEAGRSKVCIPTVFTAAPAVLKEFEKTPYAARLKKTGVITSYICPLMYMNNPLCGKMPVITSSNKLRTYTTARYYTDDEILARITKGGKHA